MSDTESKSVEDLATAYAEACDTDVLLFNAAFEQRSDNALLEVIESRRRRANVLLILVSAGGIADEAYKIARHLQRHYTSFTGFVHGYCKSAGTLCLLGAHQIVMSDTAELGPLDVQLTKRDELGLRNSGLVAGEAMTALQEKAFELYEKFLLNILSGSEQSVTFRTASEVAAQVCVGLFQPLYAQLNPVDVGEMAMSMRIGQDYGKRLGAKSDNLKARALELLCFTYPDHGFVIDSDEAQSIFRNIRQPTDAEVDIVKRLEDKARWPIRKRSIVYLCRAKEEPNNERPPDLSAAAPVAPQQGGDGGATPGGPEGPTPAAAPGEHHTQTRTNGAQR